MVKENKSLEFGYVRILTGIAKGRIGRYLDVDNNTGKAKVSFGYENDFLTYTTSNLFASASISNDITKQDLIDRYYIIVNELNRIDLRGHARIKKYSAGHTSLITECNIVRGLLNEYLGFQHLNKMQFANNIALFMPFQDVLWCNDFILDLEIKKFSVAALNHEVLLDNHETYLDEAMQLCGNLIFVLSLEACKSNWLTSDYKYIKNRMDTGKQKIHFVKITDTPIPSYAKDFYNLGKQYTQQYDIEFNRLTVSLDS